MELNGVGDFNIYRVSYQGGSMSGSVETRTKRSYAEREFGPRLALHAERRPPTFLRRPHGRHACACGRQLGAALRPRARTGSLPQTCEAPSIHRLRWCAGRCAARGRPQWLQSFGTILAALGRPLKLAPSANQVLAHTTRPPRATTTQPTHRLLSVHGRRPLDAALEAVLHGCQAAACGSSVAAGRSSRRPPCPCFGVHRGPGRPALEVRTAVGRRA